MKLLLKAGLKHWCHHCAQADDDRQNGERNQGQRNAVVKHDCDEDQQKRQVEHKRDSGAGNELTNCFNAIQASGDHTGRAMLEIQRRQFEDALEDRRTEDGINPVAGMKNEVLPQPRQASGKQHEDSHANCNDDQGAFRAVNDHFVNDGLRKEWCCQCKQLHHE